MEKNLKETIAMEYSIDVQSILVSNQEYISLYYLASKVPVQITTLHKQTVFPYIMPDPKLSFYLHTDLLVKTEDDPILRFIPYLPSTEVNAELVDYQGTDINERSYDREEELLVRYIERSFNYTPCGNDLCLLRLTNKGWNSQVDAPIDHAFMEKYCLKASTYNKLYSIAQYGRMDLERAYNKCEKYIKREDVTFDTLFCSICLVFCCMLHKPVDGGCIKPNITDDLRRLVIKGATDDKKIGKKTTDFLRTSCACKSSSDSTVGRSHRSLYRQNIAIKSCFNFQLFGDACNSSNPEVSLSCAVKQSRNPGSRENRSSLTSYGGDINIVTNSCAIKRARDEFRKSIKQLVSEIDTLGKKDDINTCENNGNTNPGWNLCHQNNIDRVSSMGSICSKCINSKSNPCHGKCVNSHSGSLSLAAMRRQKIAALLPYFANACLISLISFHLCNALQNCKTPEKSLVPYKKLVRRKTLNVKPGSSLYTPCSHKGPCRRDACSCINDNLYCELACLCTQCDNLFNYGCKCISCGNSCACARNGRECTEICSCDVKSNEASLNITIAEKGVGNKEHTRSMSHNCRSRKMTDAKFTSEASKCNNKSIQLRMQKKTFIHNSVVAGYGLFAGEDIKKDIFVIEYTGEIISHAEAERRGCLYDVKKCSYLFDLCSEAANKTLAIDATYIGNGSRFINHSIREANLKAKVMQVNGKKAIGFYAMKDIKMGQEMFFDYRYDDVFKMKHKITD